MKAAVRLLAALILFAPQAWAQEAEPAAVAPAEEPEVATDDPAFILTAVENVRQLESAGVRAAAFAADVAEQEQVQQLVREVVDSFSHQSQPRSIR